MAHDVFISYSSKDKPVGDAVCATLETAGLRCWMAPRDIRPGAEWSESIIDGIAGSKAMVLVFSANANASPQVVREVERAVNRGVVIVPFRIEDVRPSKSLEYFISTPHWMDAYSGELDGHLRRLVETLRPVVFGGGELTAVAAAGPDDPLRRARGDLYARPAAGSAGRRWQIAGKAGGTLVLAGVAAAIWCRLLGVGQPRPAAAVGYVPAGPLSEVIPVNPLPLPTAPPAAKGPDRPPVTDEGPPRGGMRLPPPPDRGLPFGPPAWGPDDPGPLPTDRWEERRQEQQQERAAAQRAAEGLHVQSIVASGNRRSCLIAGHVYTAGESVDGLTIEAIRDRSLIVGRGPFRFEVTMPD